MHYSNKSVPEVHLYASSKLALSWVPARLVRSGQSTWHSKPAQHSVDPVFKQVSWLEVGSVKVAVSRPAQKRLNEAVFATYCWKPDLSDEELLEKLSSLNLERSR
jgi:hypothetical protein